MILLFDVVYTAFKVGCLAIPGHMALQAIFINKKLTDVERNLSVEKIFLSADILGVTILSWLSNFEWTA